jgi:hypothetical protein
LLKDKLHSQIQDCIENIGPMTEMLKKEQESDITRRFQTALVKMKKQLEEQKSFKNDQGADLKDKENDMQHSLDLIT